ncbi:helix-turn-helix domain-containing protein [Ruegeria conchae]|uniref:Xre family transcriptional regulator n=1 Tax=Ruegeria conchae TaxID=981384 RepID=A0A497ZSN9_9RHOB|nr:helix-turn-helix transcriptional regulator [Ruegeria conchae]RLK10782.1 Xre family transcriptional regulator [Ruegeria conchae]
MTVDCSKTTAVSIGFPAFGKRLKRLRRVVGLKQSALADLIEVDQATISRWENGGQTPSAHVQQVVFAALGPAKAQDSALKRLVVNSSECLHLVEEATHTCLAYSASRARDWKTSQHALLGVSLWQFATDEIRQAEAELQLDGWWDLHSPAPKAFLTSEAVHDQIRISAGRIVWERLYLSDGTPVRLVSGRREGAA